MYWVNAWSALKRKLFQWWYQDKSQIKESKTKCQSKTKAHVSVNVSDASVMPRMGFVPPPDKLKRELNIQSHVQERLRHLAENARPGKEKIKSHRGGSVEVFVPYKSSGLTNLFLLGTPRTECHITNYLPSSGWLGFAGPYGRSQVWQSWNIC